MILHDPTVVERYAEALFNLASKGTSQDELLKDVDALMSVLEPNSKLRVFLETPQLRTDVKMQKLDIILKGQANPLLHRLAVLLLEKGRIEYLRPILERFKVLVEQSRGIYVASVSTAVPLQDGEKSRLQQALEQYSGKKLMLKYHVDAALIGGVKFNYGDVLIDDTVKGKLHKLKHHLEKAYADV